MLVRWLGWAGIEIESEGASVVVDPLADPAGVFAGLGDAATDTQLPDVVSPHRTGRALAGMVSHLHRDHADAGALTDALAEGAAVHMPVPSDGGTGENLGLLQAQAELEASGTPLREAEPWSSREVGPFTITALPAVDGLGDPQLSWLVEAEGRRILHLGDTVFHGYWWRMVQRHGPFDVVFAPINGAVVSFPHRQPSSPLPVALDPEQAAIAGELLGASLLVPMHYGGFALDPWYMPVPGALERFTTAARGRSYTTEVLAVGAALDA